MTDAQTPNLTEILQNLLRHIGLDVSVTPREEGNTLFLKVEGPDAEEARGKKGEVLDALQYILGKILGNAELHDQKVLIDIGDFRANREDSMKEVGRFLIEKSLKLQSPIAVYPMSSADRRVVHSVINDDKRTSSQSEGDGMARRLFVVPGPKPPRTDRPPRRFDDRGPRDDRPRDERGDGRPPNDGPPREGRPNDGRPPRRFDGPPREDRGPRDDRPRDERPSDGRPPRRFDDRGDRPPRDNRPPREDRGPRPPRPQDEPRLGTPENPYVMEPPPEIPEE